MQEEDNSYIFLLQHQISNKKPQNKYSHKKINKKLHYFLSSLIYCMLINALHLKLITIIFK